MAALTLRLFLKALLASSLYFLIKIKSTVINSQKVCTRLAVEIARISILEKLNKDCMTKKHGTF